MKSFTQTRTLLEKFKKIIPTKLNSLLKKLFLKLIYHYYSGNRYLCPCCGNFYRRLRPYGRLQKPNRCCPLDESLERHRLVWLYLKKETDFFSEPLKVLHFAPQKCFKETFENMLNLEYITTDLKLDDVTLKMDITKILYDDNYFDYILCIHVLEHVKNDQKAIREMYRVLKPGGIVIILSPVDNNLEDTFEDLDIKKPEDRKKVYGQEDHLRIYGKDFKSRLGNAGFIVKVENYAKKLGEIRINKYRLREEDIYICKKPL